MGSRLVVWLVVLVTAGLALGLVLLTLWAGDEVAIDVDSAELARAKAQHQQSMAAGPPEALEARTPLIPPVQVSAETLETFAPPLRSQDNTPNTGVVDTVANARGDENDHASLRNRMKSINSLYDRGDYESAIAEALDILEREPDNVRMLRVVVSSACMMGDADAANRHAVNLPDRDKRQIGRRCERYGIELR